MNKKSKLEYFLIALMALSATCISSGPVLAAAVGEKPKRGVEPRIELAILLDTSNSMDGLINQARSQLWKIVNEFVGVKRGGKSPHLHVALYEYGNDSLPASDGHMRMILPLTDDLDKVSEELFKLTTNGGSEYCGQVIELAARELNWTASPDDLKSIFIAGNEPFTQGPVDFREACRAAAEQGITVSTIHCGPHQTGIDTMWSEGAKLADGSYMSIDHDQVVQEITAPEDDELARLSVELNKTYVAYGTAKQQQQATERQAAQDTNAAGLSVANAAQRAATKASHNYRNDTWDLCDACKAGKVKLEDLPEDQLPESLRKMTIQQRKTYIQEMTERRAEIQQKIKQLSEARNRYVAAERKKLAEESDNTLDVAIIDAVRKQASSKNFEFE